ncbi:McrB family protein [Massilia sp. H6]|uniref:McrB family protein n=1 Tax=Massilia sp. H6 TaxID=2970464 RepID=UPI00216AA9ED|nr:AAA family ATPase [Massilia sp. H6]UVW30700.1 AAA family ATPase [Massilia sp. H6]
MAEADDERKIIKAISNNDISSKPDDELIAMLKASWTYEDQDALDVVGRLTTVQGKTGNLLHFLIDLRSVKDGAPLQFPHEGQGLRPRVFVRPADVKRLSPAPDEEPWVRARSALSPLEERDKQGNPFALTAVSGSVNRLTALPREWRIDSLELDGRVHLEESIVSMLRQQYTAELEQEKRVLEAGNRELAVEIQQLNETSAVLRADLEAAGSERAAVTASIASANEALQLAKSRYDSGVTVINSRLSRLRAFVEQRAKELLALDLIDVDNLEALIGPPSTAADAAGHVFDEVFSGDLQTAARYIQAYLHNKGIFYRQAVLLDFLALLRTNDLIVLAGDSGSGKTHLVKSFADAIGGKAVIVPVKPNWNSAEDLLGYYNPIEKRYLSTPFLEALKEAARNPETPYLLCLDEMNLARVEYYFADFLSLLEERGAPLELQLYANTEQAHALSEYKTFISLAREANGGEGGDLDSFVEMLKDERVHQRLRETCGFGSGESLLKHHAHLRRSLGNLVESPSTFTFPTNVRIIGAINVDDTTHYLSPKILDRAHIVRFESPLLQDWDALELEVEQFDLDLTTPLRLIAAQLGERGPYPQLDRSDAFVQFVFALTRDYLNDLGIEVGLRTVRQGANYANELRRLGASEALVRNNFVIHKVLPKLMFDGQKKSRRGHPKSALLQGMRDYLANEIDADALGWRTAYCVDELTRVIETAEANDGIVNYWST